MYKPQIAICITTFLRDNLLMEVLNSLLEYWSDNFIILIADQNPPENASEEKRIFYETACSQFHKPEDSRIKYTYLPHNCGLSYARNHLVEKAHKLGIPFCLISADSIKITEDIKYIDFILKYLNIREFKYDLIGLNLKNRIEWEANLNLIPNYAFELDFIKKEKVSSTLSYCLWPCDIVRNFFIAKTESLLNVKWDNNLYMGEHEDFFWRYKLAGYKVGCTNYLAGEYIGVKTKEYANIRQKNLKEGKEKLKKKYNLQKWVVYKNIERIQEKKYE